MDMLKTSAALVALTMFTAGCSMFGNHDTSGAAAATMNPPAMSGSSTAPGSMAAELPVSRDTVKQIQSELQKQGLYSGQVDGIVGPQTRAALAAYQQKEGQSKTPALDEQTLQALLGGQQPMESSGSSMPPAGGGTMTEDQVRGKLQSMGYSNVDDVRHYGQHDYTARATKNGQTHTVEFDGQTGQVMSVQ
jgi:peptidoglycan hydrolase-like protein with peptidoglycan-binding domain